MKLETLFDPDKLTYHVREGNVRQAFHNTEPLIIYCYTPQTVYGALWDEVTTRTRGLIVHRDTQEVWAKGFDKFWNLGEHGEDTRIGPVDLKPPFMVFDKADGSLGLSFSRPSDGKIQWATKGSFHSEQAEHANLLWKNKYEGMSLPVLPWQGMQVLAEIIYPSNRIVLDYGDTDDLVLLSVINSEGKHLYPYVDGETPEWWPGLTVATVDLLADSLPDLNDLDVLKEGFVVMSSDRKTRVKLKTDEYLRLHALLTNVTARKIWEHLAAGEPIEFMVENVPEEFRTWVEDTASEINASFQRLARQTAYSFQRIVTELACQGLRGTEPEFRKQFALKAQETDDPASLFATLDGQTDRLKEHWWKQVRPAAGEIPFKENQE